MVNQLTIRIRLCRTTAWAVPRLAELAQTGRSGCGFHRLRAYSPRCLRHGERRPSRIAARSKTSQWNRSHPLRPELADSAAGGAVAPGRSALAIDGRTLDARRNSFDPRLPSSARRLGPGSPGAFSALLPLAWAAMANAA